ncbi:MAG: AAA family ATPase [Lachnospiraceae bacterium]|nr:AAA family ATPase [Candidatus Colinaster scatohippi]
MPVFDFNGKKDDAKVEYTYTTFKSNLREADKDHPIIILSNKSGKLVHHSSGTFTSPIKGSSFILESDNGEVSEDILKVDSRFLSLIKWLGENHITVRLSGADVPEGYGIYKIMEMGVTVRGTKLAGQNGFLQFMLQRLFQSEAPSEEEVDIEDMEDSDSMKMTSIQSISDYMTCAGNTLPENIRLWAKRNLAIAKSSEVTPEERRHALRALSIMLSIYWKNDYFESIDPVKARQILDEELYGMEKVKQRIIETIIQINRTHTLPAYGLLLIGPAGVGKSQIAYAVAKILKMSWTTLEMSSINDPEQLTGSSRIYSNAKPGLIMEAFEKAESSNLVFIINELDKAAAGKGNGNPADVLLTLLDNLGFTDNYIECNIPTGGVYPIATANDRDQISAPLMSRFAVIELPDYTFEEKREIFKRFTMPKILKRIGLSETECIITEDGLDAIIDTFKNTSGIRDLEQAAEHIAANALYRIEAEGAKSVTYDAVMVRETL